MTLSLTELADECGTDKGSHQGFMEHYKRYLPYRHKPVILCEFGVHTGASLLMWSTYYWQSNSRIIGLDVNMDNYKPINDSRVEVYKADCTNPDVASMLTAMRPLDVIVDDASHEGPDVTKAFEAWWPNLQPGGLYVVEDTHCSYDRDHYRTADRPRDHRPFNMQTGGMATVMDFLQRLTDDVNWGIHGYNRFEPMFKDIAYVHFYPGIAFIGKKET